MLLLSGGFPWQFAVPLLRVRATVAKSLLLSQNREIAVCPPLSSLANLTLFLLVLLNPITSRDVCPTASFPALTSRASISLSFVYLTPPATSHQTLATPVHSMAPFQCGSCALWSSSFQTGHAFPGSRLSLLSRACGSASPPNPQCRWLPLASA